MADIDTAAVAAPRITPLTLSKQCALALSGLLALSLVGAGVGALMVWLIEHGMPPLVNRLQQAMSGWAPVTSLQDVGAHHFWLTALVVFVLLVSVCALCKSGQAAGSSTEGVSRSVARTYPKSFAALVMVALITGSMSVPMISGATAGQVRSYDHMALVTFHTALMNVADDAAPQEKLTGQALVQRTLQSPQWQRDDHRAAFSLVSVDPSDDSMTIQLTLDQAECRYVADELRTGNGGAVILDNESKTSTVFALGAPRLGTDEMTNPEWFTQQMPSCDHARGNAMVFRSEPYFLNITARFAHERALEKTVASAE